MSACGIDSGFRDGTVGEDGEEVPGVQMAKPAEKAEPTHRARRAVGGAQRSMASSFGAALLDRCQL